MKEYKNHWKKKSEIDAVWYGTESRLKNNFDHIFGRIAKQNPAYEMGMSVRLSPASTIWFSCCF